MANAKKTVAEQGNAKASGTTPGKPVAAAVNPKETEKAASKKERKTGKVIKIALPAILRLAAIVLIIAAIGASGFFPILKDYKKSVTVDSSTGDEYIETVDFNGLDVVSAVVRIFAKDATGSDYYDLLVEPLEFNNLSDFSALVLIYLIPVAIVLFLILSVITLLVYLVNILTGRLRCALSIPGVIQAIAALTALSGLIIFQAVYCTGIVIGIGYIIFAAAAVISLVYPLIFGRRRINEKKKPV